MLTVVRADCDDGADSVEGVEGVGGGAAELHFTTTACHQDLTLP